MSATLPQLLQAQARAVPTAWAVTWNGEGNRSPRQVSRSEWWSAAAATAEAWSSTVQPGERVLLLLPNGPEWPVALFACMLLRAVAVPVTPPLPHSDLSLLRAIVSDSQPGHVVGTLPAGVGDLPALAVVWGEPQQQPRLNDDPEALAYLQYTSGSSSAPRGVMLTHANLMANLRDQAAACSFPSESVVVCWLPLAHDMGLVGHLLLSLFTGSELVLLSPMTFLRQPAAWLQALSDTRAVFSGAPNFAYDLCVDRVTPEQLAGLDLSRWEIALSGAEPVRAQTLERFARRFAPAGFRPEAFAPCYGLAEATLFVSGSRRPERPRVLRGELVSCGAPTPSLQLTLRDPQTDLPSAAGQPGEICLEGPSVTRGYWGRMLRHGPLRTGDLGLLHEGELFIAGRLKATLIVHGINYQAEDLEGLVASFDERLTPSGCCVVQNSGGECLLAVELRQTLNPQQEEELRRKLQSAVARSRNLQLDQILIARAGRLPRTNSGKVQRQRVAELFAPSCRPKSGDLMGSLLGQHSESEATFAELGFSSVDRLELTAQLAAALGRDLASDLTWLHPTPVQLRRALQGEVSLASAWVELRGGTKPPLILVPWMDQHATWGSELALNYPGHEAFLGLRSPGGEVPPVDELARQLAQQVAECWPQGPVQLLGYCWSCSVVHELACQLAQSGREVRFVGLIDGAPVLLERLSWAQRWEWMGQLIVWTLRRKAWIDLIREWKEVARRLFNGVFPRFRTRLDERPASWRPWVQASLAHRPGHFPGEVHVFRRSHLRQGPLFLKRTSWAEHAQRVHVWEVDGSHEELLTRRAPQLACALEAALRGTRPEQ